LAFETLGKSAGIIEYGSTFQFLDAAWPSSAAVCINTVLIRCGDYFIINSCGGFFPPSLRKEIRVKFRAIGIYIAFSSFIAEGFLSH
jgi:hypothetical protein